MRSRSIVPANGGRGGRGFISYHRNIETEINGTDAASVRCAEKVM